YDLTTGELETTMYVSDNEDEAIRLAYQEKTGGATVMMDDLGEASYKYYIQGYETQRLKNLLYVLHNQNPTTFQEAYDQQEVTTLADVPILNNRQNMIPIFVVFMGSLMGLFIVIAYIFLDKDEGVVKAFAVTPLPMWKYLLSKTMVIGTTVLVSSSIITIPIMGAQPNYLLFYLLLILSTFAFSSFGLFVSSFFDNMSNAFGMLYIIMIGLMLPAFSYLVPSFDPLWLRLFPTYPLLQSMKEIMMTNTNVEYVLLSSCAFLVGGILFFALANSRFKKSLTV
ncbi:MAG: ABC transporter permease, partial [Caldisericia bacterium]|nr:ABC transporter permease [Caldisericia bacterium]